MQIILIIKIILAMLQIMIKIILIIKTIQAQLIILL